MRLHVYTHAELLFSLFSPAETFCFQNKGITNRKTASDVNTNENVQNVFGKVKEMTVKNDFGFKLQ